MSKVSALGFRATNTISPWLLPLGVTGCHTSGASLHPRAFTDALSSFHGPPGPSNCKIATPLAPELRLLPVGAGPSSWPWTELRWLRDSLPAPCAAVPCSGTRALSPRQGLGEEQALGRRVWDHIRVLQPAAAHVQSKFAFLRKCIRLCL